MNRKQIFFSLLATLGLFSGAYAADNTKAKMPMKSTDCPCEMHSNCPMDNDPAGTYTGIDFDIGVGFASEYVYGKRVSSKGTEKVSGLGDHGVAVKANLGGTYGFCTNWIIGLDVYGQYNSSSIKTSFVDDLAGVRLASSKLRLSWNVGLDVRFGVVYWPSCMIFIYGGPDWGQQHYSYNYAFTGFHESNSKFKIGGKFGAGCEQKFSTHWVMKETFDYTWYPSNTYNWNGETQTFHRRLATFLFSLGYLF